MQIRILTLILSLQILISVGCHADDQLKMNSESEGKTAYIHVVDESRGAKEFAKALSEPDKAWEMIHEGTRLYKNKEYDLAISKLKQALEISGCDEWVARARLGEAYEASGEYSLALNEVNWQIAQGPREEVIEKLNSRKKKLEDLLKK